MPDESPSASENSGASTESGFTEAALAGSLAAREGNEPISSPATTPPAPPAPEAADSGQLQLSDALKSRGYDVSQFDDDEAIVDHLVEQARASSRLPQLEQAARYVEYLSPYAEDIDKLIQSKQQPASGPAPEPEPEHYWGQAPEWDPSWEQFLETDANGRVTTGPNSPSPNLHHKYLARREWERRKAAQLVSDPVAAIRPGLQSDFESLKEEARKIAQEEIARLQQDQQANQFVVANRDWLYQQDGNGQPIFDRTTGQPVFSQRGAQFAQLCQELAQSGMDPNQVPAYALRLLPPENGSPGGGTPPQAPPATPPSAQPPADEMKQNFLAGAFTPPRGGASVASAAQPHAPDLGPEEDARALLDKAFRDAGISSIPE